MLFNAANCVVPHDTLGQRLTLKVEDVRVHNPNGGVPKLKFKTVGLVTVLFRTDTKIGISIMETKGAENKSVFDLAIYNYKSAREVYEELLQTNKIEEATSFLWFDDEWSLVHKLIELLK